MTQERGCAGSSPLECALLARALHQHLWEKSCPSCLSMVYESRLLAWRGLAQMTTAEVVPLKDWLGELLEVDLIQPEMHLQDSMAL